MKIKKITLTTMLLLVAFTTSACNKSEKVTEPVEIHFQVSFTESMSNNNNQLKQYTDAIEHFHKLHPLINVIIDYLPESAVKHITVDGGEMLQLMYTTEDIIKLLESKEAPDIMGIPQGSILKAEKKELLFDLLRISNDKEIDINKKILDLATVNGKLLSVPFGTYPNAIFYNKDLFDAAHIPYPQGDWTWEQFRDISKKLDPIHSPIFTYDISTFELFTASTGKQLLSPDGTTSIGYLDSPEAIRTLQWLNAYFQDSELKMMPKSMMDLFSPFNDNQVGMFMGNMGFRPGVSVPNIGVAPLPHFEGGVRANRMGFNGYSITQNSKHPQEAWEFIKYLSLTKNEDSIKFAESYVTTSKLMAEATGQSSVPLKSIFVDELNYATISANDINPLFNKAWNKDLTTEFEKLLSTDDKDIPVKLHDLAMKLDQELSRLKKVEDQQTVSP